NMPYVFTCMLDINLHDALPIEDCKLMNPKIIFKKVIIYSLAMLIFMVALFPFWWMIVSSLKPSHEIFSKVPTFWPHHFTLEHYVNIFVRASFWDYFKNSLF